MKHKKLFIVALLLVIVFSVVLIYLYFSTQNILKNIPPLYPEQWENGTSTVEISQPNELNLHNSNLEGLTVKGVYYEDI